MAITCKMLLKKKKICVCVYLAVLWLSCDLRCGLWPLLQYGPISSPSWLQARSPPIRAEEKTKGHVSMLSTAALFIGNVASLTLTSALAPPWRETYFFSLLFWIGEKKILYLLSGFNKKKNDSFNSFSCHQSYSAVMTSVVPCMK